LLTTSSNATFKKKKKKWALFCLKLCVERTKFCGKQKTGFGVETASPSFSSSAPFALASPIFIFF
jgi:hypothetical protein